MDKLSQELNKYKRNKSYENDVEIRKGSFFGNLFGYGVKCKEGICLYKDPEDAAKNASIVEIYGIGVEIKIMLICRVKPSKIREPIGNRKAGY